MIRNKLSLSLASLILMIFLIVGLNFYAYTNIDADSDFINHAGRMRAMSYKMAQLSANLIHNEGDMQAQSKGLSDRIVTFDKTINGLIDGDADLGLKKQENPEVIKALESIRGQWNTTFKPAYESILSSGASGDYKTIHDKVDGYVKEIDGFVAEYSAMSTEIITIAKAVNAGVLAIGIIVGILAILVVRGSVIKPMDNLILELKQISSGNGDLTKTLHHAKKDEMGELVTYFNQFIFNVRDIVARISDTSDTLNGSLAAISGTTEELARSTEMIAGAVQDVSEGSLNQSEMVNRLTSLVDEMNDQIRQVLSKTDVLLESSKVTRHSADQGKRTIEAETVKTGLIVQGIREVSGNVDELEKDSQNIQEILKLIEAISSQTNLLALNASIEAARAGEQGRGFSVVADEIRKLAEETASSTVKISDIVTKITMQTHNVKNHMESVSGKIYEQEASMGTISEMLDDIYAKSEDTFNESDGIKRINRHIESQFVVINESAHNIAQVVERNSQNTQDVAAAVEEQTASFQEVSANLSNLGGQSEQLLAIVNRFKYK